MASILIVDDHEIVRAGFKRIFEASGLHEVIGEASSSEEGVTAFKVLSPDLVIMDVMMPGGDISSAIQRIKNHDKNARVLIVTLYDHPSLAERCFKVGARGFVTKASSGQVLIQAINELLNGQRFLSPDLSEKIALNQLDGTNLNSLECLSPRELEVFMRIARGQSIAEISDQMHLSKKTVSNYSSRIKKHLNVTTTAEFVHLAIQEGIVSCSEHQ